MSNGTVLVTGGAGFIGSYVVEELLQQGYPVRVFDSLVEQVHQGDGPKYVPEEAEFIRGDVRDRDALSKALSGVDRVVHLAAEVGVGQSMYEVSRYVDANTGGTGVLLDIIANDKTDVGRIVVASSMSIYGEGAYQCAEHGLCAPRLRPESQLKARRWDPLCAICGATLSPVPTMEDKALLPTSVYAISKMDQELLCLSVGAAYGIDVVALRYFNAYGPRQALSNPYTGVAAIFSGRLLNRRPPLAFEDGHQLRDFVHVRDVARATALALESERAVGHAVNVGVGAPLTIIQVARLLAGRLGVDIDPEVTGKFRAGDIRHCWADPARAERLLGFTARIPLADGVAELIDWVSTRVADDRVDNAYAELGRRGLAVLWGSAPSPPMVGSPCWRSSSLPRSVT
jgi:dTDP-L-rhamnose 4-epimerase